MGSGRWQRKQNGHVLREACRPERRDREWEGRGQAGLPGPNKQGLVEHGEKARLFLRVLGSHGRVLSWGGQDQVCA